MEATRRSKPRLPEILGLVGLLIGFAIIHPMTMLMNHHMSGPPRHPDGWGTALLEILSESFATPSGWVWGSVYGALCGVIGFLTGSLKMRERALRIANADLNRERERSEKLILNVLPQRVADELRESGRSKPQRFGDVTVLVADIVDFSRIAMSLTPGHLIEELNELFTSFDRIMDQNHCDRIKTMGDGYLAVCGMSGTEPEHAVRMVQSAWEMLAYLAARNETADLPWRVRVGIHSGEVVGGVVGIKKYIYDIFGDAINCATRLEQHSRPMRINISESTRDKVAHAFRCDPRGRIETKGRGELVMFFVARAREQTTQPNGSRG